MCQVSSDHHEMKCHLTVEFEPMSSSASPTALELIYTVPLLYLRRSDTLPIETTSVTSCISFTPNAFGKESILTKNNKLPEGANSFPLK